MSEASLSISRRYSSMCTRTSLFLSAGFLAIGCATSPASPPPVCLPAPPEVTTVSTPKPAPAPSANPATQPAEPIQARKNAVQAGFCSEVEWVAAKNEFQAIDKLVSGLSKDGSPADPIGKRVGALAQSPCYRQELMWNFSSADVMPVTAWALSDWWENGGRDFVLEPLEHANAIHFAPTVRSALVTENLPAGHALANILCASSGSECDPLGKGAAVGLTHDVQRVALLRGSATPQRLDTQVTDRKNDCIREALKKPESGRLLALGGCVDALRLTTAELPLGRFKSPVGWLIMRGRRGHYSFCDEVRVYHLETGSAFVASRCSGLVLANNGSVDQAATAAQSAVRTQVGNLPVEVLRRLALLMWIKDNVPQTIQEYDKLPLPEGIALPEPDSGMSFGTGGFSTWAHSGQTRISYEIVDGTSPLLKGKFVWPDSADVADQVMDDLVVTAEASLVEGCPKTALPKNIPMVGTLGGVSSIDATPAALQAAGDELAAAFAKMRSVKACKK
ncbi:MAG: hypothetical protein IPK82_18805 [Polyangiaceae bacterium]|nr:hypothetical protein [Polyangiaceae bacterium]